MDKLYKCDLCDKTYKHKQSLNTHKKTKHIDTENDNVKCIICYELVNVNKLYKHVINCKRNKQKHIINKEIEQTDTMECIYCKK